MGLEGVGGVDLDARIAAVVRTEAVLGGHAEGEVIAFGRDTRFIPGSTKPFNNSDRGVTKKFQAS